MFQIASLKIIFTDSTEILFSKLRSTGLNYHFPKLSFFTDPYCAGGGYLINIAYRLFSLCLITENGGNQISFSKCAKCS